MSEKIKDLFCYPVYERALLSYCFKSVDNYYEIASMILSDDFLRPEHKIVYTMFGTLLSRKVQKFDTALIINEAKKDGVLQHIGGYEYIDAIVDMQINAENISYYMHKILDASVKYKLYLKLGNHCESLEKNAQDENVSSIDLMNAIEADVMALSMDSKFVKEPRDLSDGLDEYIEERRNNPVKICGINSGYPIMDKLLDGLVPGTLSVFCARPKVGKSTFVSNIAAYVAYTLHKPVLYVDTEMPFDQWRNRILSKLTGIRERRIKHGGYTDDEYDRINKAKKLIKKGKLFHEFMPGYTVDKLISVYKKYKAKENIGLAIFDYIKEPQNGNLSRKEYQLLGDVTTVLKDLSGELNIPFVAANQINRQDDVADSDRILRYTDVLAFLSRMAPEELEKIENTYAPFHNDYGNHKLVIKESRRGGTTPQEGICLIFQKRILTITEAKRQLIDYNEYSKKDEIDDDASDTTILDDADRESNEFSNF